MNYLAALFESDYKRLTKAIKEFNDSDDFLEVKYNSNYDDVRGSAHAIMSFIGYISDCGEFTLIGIEVLNENT